MTRLGPLVNEAFREILEKRMFTLVMYCKNRHAETTCMCNEQFRLREIAITLLDQLHCRKCGAIMDEWKIDE